MRLTTRGRYAVTALLDLALQTKDQNNAVSLSDIAKRQSISVSYLEQLFSKLRRKGIVSSTRGAAGGYRLAYPLNEIDVMTIITAVDESINATKCGGEANCQGGAMCLTHDLWYALSNHIESYLKNITLAQLLEMENVQDVSDRQRLLDSKVSQVSNPDFTETDEDNILDTNINSNVNNNIETITLIAQGYNEVHPV